MAKTKTPIKKVRHRMQLASILFSFLSFLLLFFELMLTMHGGWDDLNFYVISLIPVVAVVGVIIAMVNTVKFRSKSREIIPALSMVAVSTLFFCFMMIFASNVLLAKI